MFYIVRWLFSNHGEARTICMTLGDVESLYAALAYYPNASRVHVFDHFGNEYDPERDCEMIVPPEEIAKMQAAHLRSPIPED